ncbi:hypothetical protein ACFL1G_09405 [Planctomycetota bacterium]
MEWLVHGLRGRKACEEALWNCVWAFTKPMITKLMEVKRNIIDDIPPTNEQPVYLNDFMGEGFPRGYRVVQRDGSETYEVCLEPRTDSPRFEHIGLLDVPRILLIQPAFGLAQELQKICSKPRFVRKCRAPSCGKTFYTGRKNATNCPGSQGYKKNKCALEWIRYKRWLLKTRRNPESDWDNDKVKELFLDR